MPNENEENITPTNDETVEGTSDNQEAYSFEQTEEETTEDYVDRLKTYGEKRNNDANQLYVRLHKAKEPKQAPEQKAQETLKTNEPSSDLEARLELLAEGHTRDQIADLQAIAKGYNISVVDAKTHPSYLGNQAQQEADKKKQQGALGASNGSSTVRLKTTTTDKDRKSAWQKAVADRG